MRLTENESEVRIIGTESTGEQSEYHCFNKVCCWLNI